MRIVHSLETRLLLKRQIQEGTGCWLWLGSNDGQRGYGQIVYRGKREKVHRISAHLYLNFDLSSELYILHKLECKNTNCFNPEHLYIGTHDDNMSDVRRLITHCIHGHEYTDANTHWYNGKRSCKKCIYESGLRRKKL